MTKACRVMIAAMLVVHLMVGCCAHHAHACDGRHGASPTRETTPCDRVCSDDHDGHSDHAPHEHRHCQGEKCSFVVSATPTIAKPLVRPFASMVLPACDDATTSIGRRANRLFLSDGPLAPSTPLYLAHQSLLI